MTVKELIEKLKDVDPKLRVVISGYEGGVNDLTYIEEINIRLNVNEEWFYGSHEQVDDDEKYDEKAILI